MLPEHAGFCTMIKWAMIKRPFYQSNAAVCVTPGMPRKVFPRCSATEGRWLKWLISPMSQECQWQDQTCLFTHHTEKRALNCLGRWHGSNVPSVQLDGVVVEIFPSCPAGKNPVPGGLNRLLITSSQMRILPLLWLPRVERHSVPLHNIFLLSDMRIIPF